jgi:hypothetical protein
LYSGWEEIPLCIQPMLKGDLVMKHNIVRQAGIYLSEDDFTEVEHEGFGELAIGNCGGHCAYWCIHITSICAGRRESWAGPPTSLPSQTSPSLPSQLPLMQKPLLFPLIRIEQRLFRLSRKHPADRFGFGNIRPQARLPNQKNHRQAELSVDPVIVGACPADLLSRSGNYE